MKNKPPKGKIKQEYILPEIEISSKVEKGPDTAGKPTFRFSKERPYNAPNPRAKKTTASNIKKTISNSPSSREMEVEREEQNWLSGQNNPTPDKDYTNFMQSTERFPGIYGSKKKLGPMAKLHGGPDNKATGNNKNNTSDSSLSQIASNIPDLMKDVNAIKSRFKNFEQDKKDYHTFGNPKTLTRAKDGKVIDTKNIDEGEFSKVTTMPPLKPIVTGPKDDQYYVND